MPQPELRVKIVELRVEKCGVGPVIVLALNPQNI